VSAFIGMTQVAAGDWRFAIVCMIASGACDMFDGSVARRMKNRTQEQIMFGVEIDSLCDMVCFGAFPAYFCIEISANKWFGGLAGLCVLLAAVIRLGYFNVSELKRQEETTEKRKYYQGLPVTAIAMTLPTWYVCSNLYGWEVFAYVVPSMFIVEAFFRLLDFKLLKPGKKLSIAMCVYEFFVLVGVCLTPFTK
jgi:CDP-diacylglycerol--serine O-phosphatidyltransferase